MTKLVRIHPRDPQRGYHAERFKLARSRYKTFDVKAGWYSVDDATAQKLSLLRNNDSDPSSRPIFQICEKDEAEAIDRVALEVVAKAESPHPLPKGVEEEEWPEDMAGEVEIFEDIKEIAKKPSKKVAKKAPVKRRARKAAKASK